MLVENQEHLYLIQLGSLLENTEDGICVMDANTLLFEYANKNAQTYLGYSMAELRNLTPRDLQPTQNVVIFDEVINPLYNHQKTYVDFETVVLRPDSSTFPTEVRLYFWSEGVKVKLVGIFKDISQRKQMEQALAAHERHLQAILDVVPECIKLVSRNCELLEMTPAGLVMLEADNLAEVQSQPLVDYIKPEYRPGFIDLHKKVFLGFSGTVEFEIIGLKGGQRWLETYAVPLRDDKNNVIHMLGATRDITAHKKSEKALCIAAAAFEALEGIVVTDANKTILRVNQAFSQITGYSTEEAVSKMASFLRSKHYDVDFYHSIWAIVDRDGHWQGEVWGRHKNGGEIPFKLSITAVATPEGRITNYVNSFTDITLQKQAEKGLLDARLRLESQVAKVEDELSKTKEASAEVNTALNVLLKYRETDKTEAQSALSNEVEATILPVLKNLKTLSSGRFQSIRMVNILEKSIHQVTKNYGRAAHLDAAYHKLSPIEIQVAAMVRQGLRTKVIAANLNISPGTVDNHRKHIRKKLGLESKSSNLYSYLQSLAE